MEKILEESQNLDSSIFNYIDYINNIAEQCSAINKISPEALNVSSKHPRWQASVLAKLQIQTTIFLEELNDALTEFIQNTKALTEIIENDTYYSQNQPSIHFIGDLMSTLSLFCAYQQYYKDVLKTTPQFPIAPFNLSNNVCYKRLMEDVRLNK